MRMAIKIYHSTRFGIANLFRNPLKSRSQPITRLTLSQPATRAVTPILFALGPWSITHRLTVPSIACHVSTPSGLLSGTRCGSSSTSPDCIRSMRFRALAACASFERSGVQLPVVLGRDLRLILMGFGYCVVQFHRFPLLVGIFSVISSVKCGSSLSFISRNLNEAPANRN
jgi:hypothetical protein